jgi:hypothetical protein
MQELYANAAVALRWVQELGVDTQKILRDITECVNKEPARQKLATVLLLQWCKNSVLTRRSPLPLMRGGRTLPLQSPARSRLLVPAAFWKR